MKTRIAITLAAVGAIAAGLFWLQRNDATPAKANGVSPSITAPSASAESPVSQMDPATGRLVKSQESLPEQATDEAGPTFRVDSKGALIVDEKTRLNIEALIALTPPDKLYDATREAAKTLPPDAARQAEELVDRMIHYQSAQRQSYPPGEAPLTEEDALTQLDGLHALRVAHFGEQTATAFYDDEEKLSRELVELMRLEKDESLTLPEKAERAQALRDRLPKVAAIEEKNRDVARKTSGD